MDGEGIKSSDFDPGGFDTQGEIDASKDHDAEKQSTGKVDYGKAEGQAKGLFSSIIGGKKK